MLIKNPRLVLGATFAAVLWAGCTIKEVEPGLQTETTSGNAAATTGTGEATVGATSGGDGGGGGGDATTGVGGAGGGAPSCVGDDGTGKTDQSCEQMNITPPPNGGASSICDENYGTSGNLPPPGYDACYAAFELYTAGSAENMQACLAQISVQPAIACDDDPVVACVTKVYDEACDRPVIVEACDAFAMQCGDVMDPYDAQICKDDLRPFSDKGLQAYVDCFNANTEPCQDAHATCFAQLHQ